MQVPDALLDAMRGAECIRVDTPQALRVELLKDEYAHFLADAPALSARLAHLVPLHGRRTIERWAAAAAAGDWDTLVAELLVSHYDPTYARSMARNFPRIADAVVAVPPGIGEADFRRLALDLERGVRPPAAAPEASPMTDYAFRLVNVFAESTLAGNPLCVFEDARGLDDATMQALALQFNLSETTFVLPSSVATRAGADLHADLRDAVRRAPDARHRARGARAARHGRRGDAGDARRDHPGARAAATRGRCRPTRRATARWQPAGSELAAMLGLAEADVAPDPARPPLWVDTGSEQLDHSARHGRRGAPRPRRCPR